MGVEEGLPLMPSPGYLPPPSGSGVFETLVRRAAELYPPLPGLSHAHPWTSWEFA